MRVFERNNDWPWLIVVIQVIWVKVDKGMKTNKVRRQTTGFTKKKKKTKQIKTIDNNIKAYIIRQ